jgi:hypothetical protein
MQFMCGNQIRDGTTTNTVDPADPFDPATGMHEDNVYYDECANVRRRNDGLFIADREDNGGLARKGPARITRQNQGGGRRGFECPEERDYYPYWHWSPWRDVVIFTQNTDLCDWYRSESQNVKDRHKCVNADGTAAKPNNKAECTASGAKWTTVKAWGISKPDCLPSIWNRDNHLGAANSKGFNSYNWQIPQISDLKTNTKKVKLTSEFRELPEEGSNTPVNEKTTEHEVAQCVIRMRYNISANGGNAPAAWTGPKNFIDWRYNREASPVKQDPIVNVEGFDLELAMDTSQFGRTFQDRTHSFYIMKRPSGVEPFRRIYNLNAKGKRGNIVQAYPATEYDFSPNTLEVSKGDYVHFQFVGCDQNPAGNAGEGTAKTDRHNVVQITSLAESYPATPAWMQKHGTMIPDDSKRKFLAHGNKATCDENTNDDQATNNCKLLNPTEKAYMNAGLIKMDNLGKFYYMNSRNNNFTNRGQKSTLIVSPLLPVWAVVLLVIGGLLFAGAASVAGLIYYGRTHPHSQVNTILSKF